jgi:hypothetical protein
MTTMADHVQRAREMLAEHLTLGSATRASVLRGPPYPYGNVTIGQALKAICDALALVEDERERCAHIADAYSEVGNAVGSTIAAAIRLPPPAEGARGNP